MTLYCPLKQKNDPPLQNYLKQNESFKIKKNNTYIPTQNSLNYRQIINILAQCDNNPNWYENKKCTHCNTHNIKHDKIHKVFQCKTFNEQRQNIINSRLIIGLMTPNIHR